MKLYSTYITQQFSRRAEKGSYPMLGEGLLFTACILCSNFTLSSDLRLELRNWKQTQKMESVSPRLAIALNLSGAFFLQEYYVISINSRLNEY